jgi:death-on-curing protein
MAPTFLTLDEVLEIHNDQITRYGGAAGIRDLGLLQSALAQPRATFGGQFLHSDLFEMAAAYLFHLVKNHPFHDGNKRVGAVAAFVFLRLNDWDIKLTNPELEALVLSVAQGQTDKAAIAQFFRQHADQIQELLE